MTEDFVIDAFGARWCLDTHGVEPAAGRRLRLLWDRCRVPGARPGDAGVETFVVADGDPYAVSRALTLASLRRRRGSAVLLHAVGLSQGDRAVALVGPSGAGKSTAALTLGRSFGYLSDETVAVEADGRVAPYPKPVSVLTDPEVPWEKVESSPDELGLRRASGTAYLAGLVVLERDPARTVPELAPMPLVDALLAVIAQSSAQPMLERPLHRLAELASGTGGPYVLRYSEIGDCTGLIADLLDPGAEGPRTERTERAAWTSTPGPGAPTPAGSPPGCPGTHGQALQRTPWRDAVHGEGGTIVLVGESLVRLGPVGEVLWRASAAPVRANDLYAAVVAELGEHPDARRAVDDGITALLDTGLLRPSPGGP